jgi:hypothetical protein
MTTSSPMAKRAVRPGSVDHRVDSVPRSRSSSAPAASSTTQWINPAQTYVWIPRMVPAKPCPTSRARCSPEWRSAMNTPHAPSSTSMPT